MTHSARSIRSGVAWGLLFLALVVPTIGRLPAVTAYADARGDRAREFQQSLDNIHTALRDLKVNVVVMQPTDPETHYELVEAYATYLRGDVTVMTTPVPDGDSPFDHSLALKINNWSARGSDVLAPLDQSRPCVSVMLGDVQPVCSTVVDTFWSRNAAR